MEKLAAMEHSRVELGLADEVAWSMVGEAGKLDCSEDGEAGGEHSLCSALSIGFRPDISIEPLELSGAFLARGRNSLPQLVTCCDGCADDAECAEETFLAEYNGESAQFRAWSPYLARLAAALLRGVEWLRIRAGARVMYLGTSISCCVAHLSDMVGDAGAVYAIETSAWAGEELLTLAKRRDNVVAIVEDATLPYKYRQLVPDSVELIFCDTLHSEQLRLLILHARHFLQPGGHFAIMLPGSPKDAGDAVSRLHAEQLETQEQLSLEPYVHDQFLAAGVYNPGMREALNEA